MTHLLSSVRRRLPNWINTRTGLSTSVRLLLGSGAILAVLVSSITLYLAFYRLYVPKLVHQSPVYLQYPAANSGQNTTAVVNFVSAHSYKFLSTSQAYTVALRLTAPASEENLALGSFMVTVELCTAGGTVVQSSSRPALFPYRSYILRTTSTLLRLPLLLLGVSSEQETLHVELISDMYDRHFSPVTHARVSLSKGLQVYGADIVVRARFTGLRYWMYYWRLPTAVVFVAMAVGWQLVFSAVAWSVLESYAGRARAAGSVGAVGSVASTGRLAAPRSRSGSRSSSRSSSGSRLTTQRRLRRRARGSKSQGSRSRSTSQSSHNDSAQRQVPAL